MGLKHGLLAVGICGLLFNPTFAADEAKDAPKPRKTLFQWPVTSPISDEKPEDNEKKPISADRPDVVEGSANIDKGTVQFEMGYTYLRDRTNGVNTNTHSYPELLVRVGLSDLLELRVGQNFLTESTQSSGAMGRTQNPSTGTSTSASTSGGSTRESRTGAQDLYVGLGVNLTEQKGILPESRIIFQSLVPVGGTFSDHQVLPGFNLCYGWDVIPDLISIGFSSGINRARDDADDLYWEFAHSGTIDVDITKKLSMYGEYFGLYPTGATSALPQHYIDGGFMYKITNDVQVDIRAGFGLNRNSTDFFTGTGVAFRF